MSSLVSLSDYLFSPKHSSFVSPSRSVLYPFQISPSWSSVQISVWFWHFLSEVQTIKRYYTNIDFPTAWSGSKSGTLMRCPNVFWISKFAFLTRWYPRQNERREISNLPNSNCWRVHKTLLQPKTIWHQKWLTSSKTSLWFRYHGPCYELVNEVMWWNERSICDEKRFLVKNWRFELSGMHNQRISRSTANLKVLLWQSR